MVWNPLTPTLSQREREEKKNALCPEKKTIVGGGTRISNMCDLDFSLSQASKAAREIPMLMGLLQ